MDTWMEVLVAVCVIALTVVLIPAIVAMRRSAQRAETVLLLVERELRPLAAHLQGLAEDLRTLVRQGNRELERFGAAAERLGDFSERAGRLVGAVTGFTRVGQIVGAATGIKKGLDVFVHRLRRHGGQGDG